MDNNYYTGATLIRGSHHHHNPGHGHYSQSPVNNAGAGGNGTSLAGPPLLMQPRNNKNLFSGAPLIRNGSMNGGSGVSVPSNAVPTQPQPSGVICCFQPVYYVPMQQNPQMHTPQLSLPPPPIKKVTQPQMPKRRNYKSLHINKSNPPPVTTSLPATPVLPSTPTKPARYQPHSILNTPIMSPIKSNYRTPLASHEGNSSPVDKIFSHGDENELNFQSAIESSRYLISNEEKQRSDKLLNFYFYDEHWRPQESEPTSSSSSSELSSPTSTSGNMNYGMNSVDHRLSCQDIENDWINHIHYQNQLNTDDNVFPSYANPNNNKRLDMDETALRIRQGQSLSEPNSKSALSASAMVIKKKDLEVEAQIVTLANGHRDLEIRLCYVTS